MLLRWVPHDGRQEFQTDYITSKDKLRYEQADIILSREVDPPGPAI